VMDIAQYEFLREQELEAAWFQTREDVAAGRYRQESAEDHIIRVRAELSPSTSNTASHSNWKSENRKSSL